MILPYIFSMAIFTNVYATLLLFCVSVQFSPLRFTFHMSHFVALFWHGGGVKERGRVKQAWSRLPGRDVIDHNWSRHHHWAEACGWIVSFYSLALQHACLILLTLLTNACVYEQCLLKLKNLLIWTSAVNFSQCAHFYSIKMCIVSFG